MPVVTVGGNSSTLRPNLSATIKNHGWGTNPPIRELFGRSRPLKSHAKPSDAGRHRRPCCPPPAGPARLAPAASSPESLMFRGFRGLVTVPAVVQARAAVARSVGCASDARIGRRIYRGWGRVEPPPPCWRPVLSAGTTRPRRSPPAGRGVDQRPHRVDNTSVPTATPPKPRKPAPPRPQQQPKDAPAGTAAAATHAELMDWVRKNPPPAEWLDDDSDPFTPAAPEPAAK